MKLEKKYQKVCAGFVLLVIICVALSGCPALDEVVGASCCCEGHVYLLVWECADTRYSRTGSLPEEIEVTNTAGLGFGSLRRAEASGGVDRDFLFPEPGDEWYSHCPDCSTLEPCDPPADYLCYLTIENTNRPFFWTIKDHVEWYRSSGDISQFCYYAVNPTFPAPVGESGVITFEVTRLGAQEDEWRFSGGEWELIDNYAEYVRTRELYEPITHIMNWAANESVMVNGGGMEELFENAIEEAAERLRRQKTDHPDYHDELIFHFYNNNDSYVHTS